MNLKYRIKKYTFIWAPSFYTAQYKILGMWLNINIMGIGRFSLPSSVICENIEEAQNRIRLHKLNMDRAKEWVNRESEIIEI